MTTTTTIDEIPAALPATAESEAEREKLLKQAAETDAETERLSAERDDEDDETDSEDAARRAKPSKKKLFLAFVAFVLGFVLLLALLCWFFGIGFFAAAKKQTVDRTAKTNQTSAPATEDEKLKMALNIVAEKSPNSSSDANLTTNANGDASSDSSVTVPPANSADFNAPVVVPDPLTPQSSKSINVQPIPLETPSSDAQNILPMRKNADVSNGDKSNSNLIGDANNGSAQSQPAGRSLFFGVQKKAETVSALVSPNANQTILRSENAATSNAPAPIPFGTLLPVRFLGAVFTLRASGGLVRMELTRAVSGKNYSFPAGTILVGTLRGSEYKRAFVSDVGLIDPNTGGLVKFEGEVLGGDGASGVLGRRRKVKGAWSRVLAGLREVGASAAGVIGSRRSGGTVVISDSQSKISGVLSQELGGVSRGDAGEFVEISAGTNAYVLVTDLPDEISDESFSAQNTKSATGLSDDELATLFSDGSPARIRAALPKMTPQFRRLAEQALAAMESER